MPSASTEERNEAMKYITINNVTVYDERTAVESLESLGLDWMDIEDFKSYLCESEAAKVADAEKKAKATSDEFRCYELYVDGITSMLNEVLNIVDEALDMQRISKPRERLEAIRKMVETAF